VDDFQQCDSFAMINLWHFDAGAGAIRITSSSYLSKRRA